MVLATAEREDKREGDGIAAIVAQLNERFGERCSVSHAVREHHGHTTSLIANQIPDALVFAQSTEEVSEIVKICAVNATPVIPFGAGTSLEGHVNAPVGGVCIDLSQMNEVVKIFPEDLNCVVQPGITRTKLNEYLRDTGLFFTIDPGADASIGGMVSTRASGTNAVRYGTMKDNILALTAVMPDGTIGQSGEKVFGRVRSHPSSRRLGRNAGRHHRGHLAAAGHSGSDFRWRVPVPGRGKRLQCGDPDYSVRHSGCAHRAA